MAQAQAFDRCLEYYGRRGKRFTLGLSANITNTLETEIEAENYVDDGACWKYLE